MLSCKFLKCICFLKYNILLYAVTVNVSYTHMKTPKNTFFDLSLNKYDSIYLVIPDELIIFKNLFEIEFLNEFTIIHHF